MMDPNATYETLRFHVTLLVEQLQDFDANMAPYEQVLDTADTVAEAFDALDIWLRRDGFFPREWVKNR